MIKCTEICNDIKDVLGDSAASFRIVKYGSWPHFNNKTLNSGSPIPKMKKSNLSVEKYVVRFISNYRKVIQEIN